MIRFFTKNQYKNTVLALWALLAILQACFTELMDDEAYYWVYSNHLAWGYFDHPPMVALLIKAGYALFHNELGVRLGMIVLNLFTLILIDKLIPHKNNIVFYLILAGMGAMQIGGILAVPDIPLIFFATLYFYIYRNFLESQSWKNTFLLGLSMALMFYSKYHGVLLVFFTLLSNLSLLKVYRYYIAVIITTLLFFPHIYWQYTHDFPSLQYHLVERNASSYDISYTLDYILGQVLLFGPLVGWLLLYNGFRAQVRTGFERALKFCLVGVLAFFLLSTLKGRVEANWTVMIFAPLVILAHQAIVRQGLSLSFRILKSTWVISLLVVFVARIYMVWDFVPGIEIRPEIHHNREWTSAVAAKAQGRPVVFLNSYQEPSKYMFYTGGVSYSLNSVHARRSQYNYWHMEEELWGKDVLLVSNHRPYIPDQDSVFVGQRKLWCRVDSAYYSYSLIQFVPAVTAFTVKPGEEFTLKLGVKNGYDSKVLFDKDPFVGYAFSSKADEDWRKTVEGSLLLSDALQRDSVEVLVVAPDVKGKYTLKIAVPSVRGMDPTHNSPGVKVTVE
ncbi:hypothetical protein GFS24_17060 [Chitinophaga sp. SYP-B3965]|uniref:ArnT family glycosyltransferase n=1 Tax=Chitinophaga sp. SYP-B3965 TaxID=2663120 RepID=UPI001299BEE0|nr:glycosyltransferase family 39 protein [Chitinophaga sp. SYP-B3965]MRG46833.1 hypothetical protein [Chitinophaga sp. SYP-B3965]